MDSKLTTSVSIVALLLSAIAIGISLFNLNGQLSSDNQIQEAISENSRIEDGLNKTISSIVATAQCSVMDIESGHLISYICEGEKSLKIGNDTNASVNVITAVQRYFNNSSSNSLISTGFNNGKLEIEFMRFKDQPYTYTVSDTNGKWELTCIKPISSGEICPKS